MSEYLATSSPKFKRTAVLDQAGKREYVARINWPDDARGLRKWKNAYICHIIYYSILHKPILQTAQYQLTAKPTAEVNK